MKPVNLDKVSKDAGRLGGFVHTREDWFESMIYELRLRRQIEPYFDEYCMVCSGEWEHKKDCPVKALEEMEKSEK